MPLIPLRRTSRPRAPLPASLPRLAATPLTVRIILFLCAFLAAPARAQTDEGDPLISTSPGTGTFTSPSLAVSIRFFDHVSLDTSTRLIVLNGTVVTGAFTHTAVASVTTPTAGKATTSTATLTLSPGVNTLTASICDNATPVKNCTGTYSYTYTYVAGRPAVRVSPDGAAATAPAWTTQVHTFRVVNPGTGTGTYRLSPECRDAWTGGPHTACTASPSPVSVAPGDSTTVTVTATGVAAGRMLLVRMSAELQSMPGVADAGWMDVTVAGAGGSTQAAPLIQAVPLTPGAVVDRSECVTVAVAPGAAYECGDVRIAHGLPAQRTYDRAWAPALLYNSQHAYPRPVLYADVTLPEGAAVPTTVQVVATIGGVAYPATYPGSDFTPGVPRRVAVQLDASAWPTGLRPYVMQATANYPSASVPSGTLTGELPIVNRAGSPFGVGWWMAGLEQLICIDCGTGGARMLWIGGDGSTRVYEPLSWWQSWVAQNPHGAPDTLQLVGYSYYVRKIPGGGRVEFGGSGQHLRTVNRLGQTTTFFTQTSGVPDSIYAPVPAGRSPRKWKFTYGPWLGEVRAVTPGAADRVVTLGHATGGGRITSITDPDGVATGFTYSQAAGGPNAVETVTDRRGTRHAFTYDAAWKLASARLYMSGASPGTGDLISSFQAGESRGVGSSVPLSQAYTLLDGPRTDVADHTMLWLTTQGAPRRIRDAMGGETLLTRGDGRFPSLVTAVRGPNARGDSLVLRSSAAYDARGRVTSDTVHNPLGNGVNGVTTYGWNDAVDRPAWIKAPGADTVRIAYDTATRNPKWQEQGDSTRRVRFEYNAAGQVERIRYPHPVTGAAGGGGGGEDLRFYEVMGNLKRTVSPMGFVTLMYRDALGRVVETRSPVHAGSSSDSASVADTGLRQTVAYSVMDRDTLTVTYGRAMTLDRQSTLAVVTGTPAETLTVRTTYDAGGLPLKVRRWSTPDTAHVGVLTASYEYDRAGRRTAEGDTVEGFDYTIYDPAGNVVQRMDRRMYAVNTTYDALGRVTRRIVPSVLYEPEDVNCADLTWTTCSFHFPTFPNAANGRYMVRADTSLFSYDAVGGMVRAENGDAIVSRTYYPGGALATDSLRIRSWDRARDDLHVYGIAYGYDQAGRMRSLEHPRNLTGGVAQSDEFRYDPVTSALDSVVSRTGLRFGFQQDLLGRVVRDTFPGGTNTYRYDLEGRRTAREGAYTDSLSYDARGKVLSATFNGSSVSYNHYSGLGNLVATEWRNLNAAQEVDEYRLDALGHTVWSRSVRDGDGGNHPEYRYGYDPGQSRISLIFNVLPTSPYADSLQFTRDTTRREYDEAGNVQMGERRSWRTDIRKIQTRPYFGADGRLRAEQGYEEMNGTPYMLHERRGYFSEHRYDALGRRVLIRTRRDGLCYKGTSTIADCTGGITRYVWAGDNLLWEMRGPGADSVPATRLNDISASGQEFGVVGYTHAGGVDRPLVVWKGVGATPTEVVVPHANWRGVFGKGTTSSGATSTVAIEWPGFKTTAYHRMAPSQQPKTNWMGSLIGGQRDPGGTMYMRNRYYDPQTGQFTQTDPIGTSGGLNLYGYASGDPVTYFDPFGLKCKAINTGTEDERLKCTNVTESDFRQIGDYLGGTAGENAYAALSGNSVVTLPEGPRYIQLMFIAKGNDLQKFRMCPDNVSHFETEGMFEGLWTMESIHPGRWMRLVGPFKQPDIQPFEWYRGTVRTAEYGTVRAAGHIWCETGDAEFKTGPIPIP